MPHGPRIALLGLALESNRWSKPATEADFRAACWLEGEAMLVEARAPAPAMPMEAAGFIRALDATGEWVPVPILLAATYPAGPIEEAAFEAAVTQMEAGLAAAGTLDAVYICNHGGMTATHTFDPDGEMVSRIRRAVGPKARIVMTLDLHANISERMVEQSDLIVGYRTNPHVDYIERGVQMRAPAKESWRGAFGRRHGGERCIASPRTRVLSCRPRGRWLQIL